MKCTQVICKTNAFLHVGKSPADVKAAPGGRFRTVYFVSPYKFDDFLIVSLQ